MITISAFNGRPIWDCQIFVYYFIITLLLDCYCYHCHPKNNNSKKTLTLRWHMPHQDYQHHLISVVGTSYTLELSRSFEMYPKAPACNETYMISITWRCNPTARCITHDLLFNQRLNNGPHHLHDYPQWFEQRYLTSRMCTSRQHASHGFIVGTANKLMLYSLVKIVMVTYSRNFWPPWSEKGEACLITSDPWL